MDTPQTLLEAVKFFGNPVNCREFMVSRRWPNGVTCPQCGSDKVYFDSSRNGWECKTRHPKRKFTLKTGTIFEDSPLGMDKWLPAVWMIANMKNGISSHELARAIGVTQKTAWFMLHRIRLAMQSDDGGKLGGEVEVDETYIGGLARNMHQDRRNRTKGRTWYGKVAVMGLLARHGEDGTSQVRTRIVKGVRRKDLVSQMREHIVPGSDVFTDALPTYSSLNHLFRHQFIDHSESYVRENVHTNGLENYWSLLKRAIKGTYVSVEPFHLFRYLDEQAFRFNQRTVKDAERFDDALRGIVGKRVMYQELTAALGENSPA
jgi:transposase-like protein